MHAVNHHYHRLSDGITHKITFVFFKLSLKLDRTVWIMHCFCYNFISGSSSSIRKPGLRYRFQLFLEGRNKLNSLGRLITNTDMLIVLFT